MIIVALLGLIQSIYYVELKEENETLINIIREYKVNELYNNMVKVMQLVNNNYYGKQYIKDYYDCFNFSRDLVVLLTENGYTAKYCSVDESHAMVQLIFYIESTNGNIITHKDNVRRCYNITEIQQWR